VEIFCSEHPRARTTTTVTIYEGAYNVPRRPPTDEIPIFFLFFRVVPYINNTGDSADFVNRPRPHVVHNLSRLCRLGIIHFSLYPVVHIVATEFDAISFLPAGNRSIIFPQTIAFSDSFS